jgi:hypothetical protein
MSALPPKAGKQCYGLASAEADDAEIQDHSYKRVKQRLELRNRIAARAERLCSPLLGQKSIFFPSKRDFRLTPESGHSAGVKARPLRAKDVA